MFVNDTGNDWKSNFQSNLMNFDAIWDNIASIDDDQIISNGFTNENHEP